MVIGKVRDTRYQGNITVEVFREGVQKCSLLEELQAAQVCSTKCKGAVWWLEAHRRQSMCGNADCAIDCDLNLAVQCWKPWIHFAQRPGHSYKSYSLSCH